jgi:hypothetical protein
MMILVPFLIAFIPGIILIVVTWWFRKKSYPLFVRMLPGTLLSITAVIILYISLVYIRGFEGGAYGILSFFLIIFAIISFFIGKKTTTNHN